MFLADDLGWTDWQYDAHLNPTGSVLYETPNLLRLAAQSVNFTNAYAPAPVCSPTRGAILTGKSPARTRMTDYFPGTIPPHPGTNVTEPSGWVRNIPANQITLAESLSSPAAGYMAGFFGKWHLGSAVPSIDPLQNGFQVNVGGTSFPSPDSAGGYFAGSDGMWAGMPGLNTPGQFPADKYLSDALDEKAVDFITQQAGQSQPFFLEMANYLVHKTLEAPADLVTKYQNKIATLQGQGVDLKGQLNPYYAAMVEKMDQSVGRLIDRLDDPNGDGNKSDSIRNNTIFIFTSDNGGVSGADRSPTASSPFPTSNLPLREGKGSLYEGGIREPLMFSWTGNANFAPGSITGAQTSLYDIYPTLLDLTGLAGNASVPRNSNMDGVSIRAALEGNSFDRGYLFWHYPHFSPQDFSSPLLSGGAYVSAALNGAWKLLFFYDDQHFELYNLASDVGETTNLLGFNPGIAHNMSLALNNYLASVGALLPIDKVSEQPVALPTILAAPLAGDYNGDSHVDALDYLAWKANYGSTTHLAADGNGDGIVDAADYTFWRNLLAGLSSSTGALSKTVPEPGGECLVYAGAVMQWIVLRRGRRSPLCRSVAAAP